jgi:hypothetical protein
MQKRIYRFEIVRGMSHAIYQAKDLARGLNVTIYEWTPDAQELAGCLKVLEGIARSDAYEVFSSGASLYLAATTDQAAETALKLLREAGLFSGVFAGGRPAAPPPPPPPLEPKEETRDQGWARRLFSQRAHGKL